MYTGGGVTYQQRRQKTFANGTKSVYGLESSAIIGSRDGSLENTLINTRDRFLTQSGSETPSLNHYSLQKAKKTNPR